jgi:transcriptional regulator of heat shock response
MNSKTEVNISQRQGKILAAIVKEHSESGEPVASSDLVTKYHFDVSPATVRNEMQVLEKEGLITQPHTSAGRVPTDKGFRYFINELMERVKLTLKEQDQLKKELMKLQIVNAEIGRRLAKLLSSHTDQASFVILPEEISTTGISNILDNPALPKEDAKEIARFFDSIDDYAEQMIKDYSKEESQALIGKEIALSEKSDYSMIVSGLSLPSGKKGVIGLIGPKSMKYEKNLSLMEYIAKLMKGGSLLALIFLIN